VGLTDIISIDKSVYMDEKQRARLGWIKLYEEVKDAGLVCRRCGISRPTLRKWLQRYQEHGIDGLCDKSRRPHSSPSQKVRKENEVLILTMRKKRHLGAKQISSELFRLHESSCRHQQCRKF